MSADATICRPRDLRGYGSAFSPLRQDLPAAVFPHQVEALPHAVVVAVGAVALIEVLWVNTHGAFPLGVVLPGMFLVATGWQRWPDGGYRVWLTDRSIRCYLGCVLAGAAAMFCNPRPEATLGHVFGVSSTATELGIGEWVPTAAGSFTGTMFFLSIIFVIIVGLGPYAGILALTVHSIAALGKLYSESIESIDPGPIEAIHATGANWLQTVMFAVVPQIIPPFVSFTIYRWDIKRFRQGQAKWKLKYS